MRNLILSAVTGVALCVASTAGAVTLKTLSASGNSTWGAQVIFPVIDRASTTRIVSVNYSNDTAAGAISFRGGSTVLTVTSTNTATTATTNQVSGTNGLAVGSLVVLQHLGVCYTNTVVLWNQSGAAGPNGGTNVVMTTGGWGVIASPGDNIYIMDTAVTIPVKAESSAQNGYAIYSAALPGRPVMVSLGAASATNKLYSVVGAAD